VEYLIRLYYTLRPLKWRQIWYRLYYPLQKKIRTRIRVSLSEIQTGLNQKSLPLSALPVPQSYDPSIREFRFLNIPQTYPHYIDWDNLDHGLLWAYHLNYFEWLYDEHIEVALRLRTIQEYTETKYHKVGNEPYPSALRIISWIRFFLKYPPGKQKLLQVLYEDSLRLYRFPEYHLDGNHLWENGLAIIQAGLFFQNTKFLKKGQQILFACFKDQLFEDGGHKEGSPMYQSLLVWRLLQTLEIWRVLQPTDDGYLTLQRSAEKMFGWSKTMLFCDASWPQVNDSIPGIAPDMKQLLDYAQNLGISPKNSMLKDSGYRMFRRTCFELFIDAAPISPAFQPGHQHADTGNFCLHYLDKPFIVDTGISSYDNDSNRQFQRGSLAHNVMTINGKNSSDVWSRFRVGKRARILKLTEESDQLRLTYVGSPGNSISRIFKWSENQVQVLDEIAGNPKGTMLSNLHFAADVYVEKLNERVYLANKVRIELGDVLNSELVDYELCTGFNKVIISKCLRMVWKSSPASMIFIFPSGAAHDLRTLNS